MDKTRPFRPPEKKPAGGVRLWQLVLCLVFFVAALFLRAFTPVRADFLVTGASSLRELAEQAGQALARSELVRVFAGSFRSACAAEADPVAPAAGTASAASSAAAPSATPRTAASLSQPAAPSSASQTASDPPALPPSAETARARTALSKPDLEGAE